MAASFSFLYVVVSAIVPRRVRFSLYSFQVAFLCVRSFTLETGDLARAILWPSPLDRLRVGSSPDAHDSSSPRSLQLFTLVARQVARIHNSSELQDRLKVVCWPALRCVALALIQGRKVKCLGEEGKKAIERGRESLVLLL